MMSNTISELQNVSDEILLREQYNIMCGFENRLSLSERASYRGKFSFKLSTDDEGLPSYFEMDSIDKSWIKRTKTEKKSI